MNQLTPALPIVNRLDDLEQAIESYEADAALGKQQGLAQYLPAESDPHYLSIAVELIRVDLERRYDRGDHARVETYRAVVPALFNNSELLAEVAFEEYRLRTLSGENPTRAEYSNRLRVDTSGWRIAAARSIDHGHGSELQRGHSTSAESRSFEFPEPGESFAGFKLMEVLGRGAFGIVFLARQSDLAAREVALKITPPRTVEAQRLARLQHTNIVPIHSLHRDRGLLAICMPFLGRDTLADILSQPAATALDAAGSTVAERRSETVTIPVRGQRITDRSERAVDSGGNVAANKLPSGFDAAEIVLQLADGLTHAHARGIVHSDLKPANVLIADDGAALLLDFNLSNDSDTTFQTATLLVGGTLPYMSPEQLQAFRDGSKVSPASDIFSLGVIFHELLTGTRPFPEPRGTFETNVETLISDRRNWAGTSNAGKRLSPALCAIVDKCLSFSPADRYTAAELAEDIRRHRSDLALRFAKERSVRERSAKWLRRNYRTVRIGAMLGIASLAVCMAALMLSRQTRLADLEASHAYSAFVENARSAVLNLHIPGTEPDLKAIGQDSAENALQQFNLLSPNFPKDDRRFARLSSKEQEEVRRQALALLQALSHENAPLGGNVEHVGGKEYRAAALRLFGGKGCPDLDAELVNVAPSSPGFVNSGNSVIATAEAERMGDYLKGVSLLEEEQFDAAVPVWQRLSDDDRQDPVRWFLLGNAFAGSGRLEDAESCYTAVIALQPRALAGYFNRGMCRYQQRAFRDAERDFTDALKLRPNLPAALINRALTLQAIGEAKRAEADATAAIGAGIDDPRAYLVRALIRDALRDGSGAAADRSRGFELAPLDDRGWMARGMACLTKDPERARSEFEKGLSQFPNSPGLMKNLIHLYADRLNQPQLALPIIEKLIARTPDDSSVLASRAVALARLGDREKAHRDATQVARNLASPITCLQIACVYALTAKSTPEDSALAIKYFRLALARQPDLITRAVQDPDLEAIKSLPEFSALAHAAGSLTGSEPAGNDSTSNQPAQ